MFLRENNNSMTSTDTYLFIDGEYLRRKINAAVQSLFLCDAEIDFYKLKSAACAKRVFYYDCIDDEQKPTESKEDYERRVAGQEAAFNRIGELNGVHVRYGSLKGSGRKRRQKEVDVLLAVDMLTHGYDGNMGRAVLIAGDLDFRPVVEAVVRRGVMVEIWYEPTSGAPELPGAADYGQKIDFNTFYSWNTSDFQHAHRLPECRRDHGAFRSSPVTLRQGTYKGRPVALWQEPGNPNLMLRAELSHGVEWYDYPDQGILERFFAMRYGPIEWR